MARPDIGYATRQLWKTCDEIIATPIEKIELRARLHILLRARAFSRELENRYYTLARSAPIGVFLLKRERVVWVNPFLESLLGQPSEALTGHNWQEWFLPEDRRSIDEAADDPICTGRIATGEGIRWAEVRVTPVGPAESQGFLGVLADVTGEREVTRIKEEFLASVSHELRTPLTAILGFSEFLLPHLPAEEDSREFAQHIHEHAEHLEQIVGDLLNLAQLRAGWELPTEKTRFDLREALEALLDRFRLNHPGRDFTLQSPAAVPVRADRVLILQAMSNLIGNAVKFSSSTTPVEIKVQPDEAAVRMELVDHGIGMSTEQATRAPEVFYRVDSSMTAIGGFGLGLTVARSIIEAHGGTLGIESSSGKGTKVTVTLPS
jgi:PAS domain S-box-containing protein